MRPKTSLAARIPKVGRDRNMNQRSNHGLLFGLFLLSGWGLLEAQDPPSLDGKTTARLNLMVSDALFASSNRNDAMSSMKVFIDALAVHKNLRLDTRIQVTPSIEEVGRGLRDKSVDMLLLDTMEYLNLSKTNSLEVIAIGSSKGQVPTHHYLLLVRDPAVSNVSELAGKDLLISSRTKWDFGIAWMESLLAEARLGRIKTFFGSMNSNYRPSSCVLPLFFGKTDACVVDSLNYELLKELNPQLGKLKAIARTEPIFEGLLAMPTDPHPYRREIIESVHELHRLPSGEQILTIFKVGPMVPPPQGVVENMRRLFNKLLRLTGPVPRKVAATKAVPPGQPLEEEGGR